MMIFWHGLKPSCFFLRTICSHEQLRDYSQDLDALLVAKPARLSPEMVGMYADHIANAIMADASGEAGRKDVSADVEDAEDRSFC